ncbi:MAG: tRNA lysidine(34) synthetase TilS, partial [Bacilli bacterium]|nr:tRNA lysidine(34) synthetase TilS [Bacilli bacterium]
KIEVKGLNGSKKVKDIFIDSKIEKTNRDLWPIVVDSLDRVVWIPGIKKSKFDKKNEESYDIILKYD